MLCLMGHASIATGGASEPLRLRPKELALLARLALAGDPVPRTDLAELLFPDADDPRGALRWHLSDLRTKLPQGLREGLHADPGVVGMTVTTDVAAFRAGAARVRDRPGGTDDPEILNLYRGDLCAGLAVAASPSFDTWLFVEQEGLRRLFRQAAVSYARWAAGTGALESAIGPLSKLVSIDPYYEEGHVLLVEAFEALGEREAARSAYALYQRIVREELHAEPRPSLARRYEGRARAGPTLPREDLVSLREVTLHVVEWPGEEPAVLGIHGSAGSAYSLTALGELLAPGNRFVAMDLRGHGFSDKPPSGYDLPRHVDDITQLIGALGLRRPAVVGHSLGGAVAAAVAATCDVSALVLLEGAVGDRRVLVQRGRQSIGPTGETLELRFKSVEEYLTRWRAENTPYSDEAERWLERFARFELAPLSDGRFRRRGLREALVAEYTSVLDSDTLGTLARVRCPVLVVQAGIPWIEGERWLTDDAARAQVDACRSGRLFVARASNHASLIRDPEPGLVQAIRDFVTAQRSQ